MLIKLNQKRAQTLVEYVAIITILLGAFVAVSSYFKRGVQGRWKDAVDQMGDQYDPRTASGTITHILDSTTATSIYTTRTAGGYWTNREDTVESTETKSGTLEVGAYTK